MISKWNDNWIVNCLRSAFRRRVNAAACKTIMAFESLQTLPDTSLFFYLSSTFTAHPPLVN